VPYSETTSFRYEKGCEALQSVRIKLAHKYDSEMCYTLELGLLTLRYWINTLQR